MIRTGREFWRLKTLAAFSMLLAAVALVLHAALPAMAMPHLDGSAAIHANQPNHLRDCHGHATAKVDATAEHAHGDTATGSASDPKRLPRPDRQMDCCTTVAAAVLPLVTHLDSPDAPTRRFVLARAALLKGLPPPTPSEPPRPTDQV